MPPPDECSLHDLIEAAPGGKLPLATALKVGVQLAHAVGEVHECHIVLRDLKPSNVLLDKWGGVVVADFGISTRLESTYVTAADAGLAPPLPLILHRR
jgi:serine/threonine protein kinase